jgi:hypothetical protein
MRRTLTVCRSGLSVAAAFVLLTACGGSDDNSDSSASSETSASETESEAPEADSEFCTEAASIEDRVSSTLNDQSDPTALPQALQQAADEIRAIEPPDEIAADWEALAGGVEQIAAAFAQVNFNDPNALATFEAQVGQLQAQLESASTNVETYLREECGIDTGESEPASPTS